MRRKHLITSLIALRFLILAEMAMAAPVGTAFTYQGQLKNAGSPTNGNTDMSFSLWDAASGGTQQSSTLTFTGGTAVNVTNGLFTLQLDFGVNSYTANAARWLEIVVNGTTLTPRQPLTPTPFALNTRGLTVKQDGRVGVISPDPLAALEVQGGADDYGGGGGPLAAFAWHGGGFRHFLRTRHADGAGAGNGFDFFLNNNSGSGGSSVPGIGNALALCISGANGGSVGIGTTSPGVKLEIDGGTDASLTEGGYLQAGLATASNIVIDDNEIMARNNSGASTLFLNNDGGNVIIGATVAGKVGIGTTTPSEQLSLTAGILVDANGAASGAPQSAVPYPGIRFGATTSGEGISSNRASGSPNQGGIDVYTARVARLSVTNSGNVGIGTTAPARPLDVRGVSIDYQGVMDATQTDGNNLGAALVGRSSTPDGNGVLGEANVASGDPSHFPVGIWGRCSAENGFAGFFEGKGCFSGNVGIGTFNPAAPLHIVGSNNFPHLKIEAASTAPFGAFISLDAAAIEGGKNWHIFSSGATASEGQGNLIFQNANDNVIPLALTSGGSVGIGTTSPGATLDVNGTARMNGLTLPTGAAAGKMLTSDASGEATWQDPPAGSQWATQGSNIAYSAGNVGIGTTSPGAPLHIATGGIEPVRVEGSSTIGTWLNLNNSTAGARFWRLLATGTGNGEGVGKLLIGTGNAPNINSATLMTFDPGGNVGIGTTSPSQKLSVTGNICATGTIGACSDARFKDHIEPVANALDMVEQLHGVTFDWKRDEFCDHQFADGRQLGFIAQQVRQVLPQVVSEGSDGYLSVDYGRLTPVIVEAVKQLREEKDAKIAELIARVQKLETLVDRLAVQATPRQ